MNLPNYFNLARLACIHSNFEKRRKMGCVIVKKKPISIGFNTNGKSYPIYYKNYKFSIHAELSAIIHCEADLKGASIYIYRELHSGKPALARPCELCLGLIVDKMIKKIYYTIDKDPYYEVIEL